jgi:UDP-N-acetylmuramate: L-alanyl-gamma-D-glutamyl-meso-diaminopimelate ligase
MTTPIFIGCRIAEDRIPEVINIVPRSGLIIAGVDSPLFVVDSRGFFSSRRSRHPAGRLARRDIAPANEEWASECFTGCSRWRLQHSDARAFNVQNAQSHCAGKELGIENGRIQGTFLIQSVKRRLELRGEVERIRVYETSPIIRPPFLKRCAIRERYPTDRIWAVFEPRSQTCRRRSLNRNSSSPSIPRTRW